MLALAACGAEPPVAEAPLAVSIAQVQRADAAAYVEASGTVAYRLETPMGFTSPGRVASVTVQEGDSVARGKLLAALDPAPVEASLASAQAEATRAGAELRRSEDLLRQGWVTRARVDNARAAAQAANANVRAASFQSSTARIFAPSSGQILARVAEPGQVIAAGSPVVIVGEASGGLVMRVPLSDRDAGRVRQGAPVTISLPALEIEGMEGQVIELGGRASQTTGSFLAEIALPADERLRSGQIGRARITVAPVGDARPVVPPAALFAARAGEALAYVVGPDNKVKLRKLKIAETGDAGVQIVAGIAPGEWVATSQIDRLRDGMTIAPKKRAP